MNEQKICKRCLLAESGQTDLAQTLAELKTAIPAEEKTLPDEYERRLSLCRECDELYDGTCSKCGCYVEFRALKKRMYCPDTNKKW